MNQHRRPWSGWDSDWMKFNMPVMPPLPREKMTQNRILRLKQDIQTQKQDIGGFKKKEIEQNTKPVFSKILVSCSHITYT